MNFTSMNDTSCIIDNLVHLIKMNLKCGDSLLDVERELFKWLLKLGQYTLEKAMRSLLSGCVPKKGVKLHEHMLM